MLEALSNVANKMPASLSSNISSKDQQQSNSLYSSNSSLKTTSIVTDSLLSTTQQQNEQTNKMKLIKDSELIDNKFNELAKKILEELKQTQYSKEFFKAIDDIIREPTSKSFTSSRNNYLSKRANYHNKYQKLLGRQQQQILQQQHQLQQLLTKDRSQTRASQTDQQPRSLPVDVSIGIQQQQQQQRQSQQQQQLVTRRKTNLDTTPSNNDGSLSTAAITSPNRSGIVYQKVQNSYPLSRSATAVESMPNNKRQQQQQQLSRKSSNVISSSNQDNCENNNQYLYRRHKNYSAGNVVLNNLVKRSIAIDNHNHSNYHDDDGDDDDDDDDEDDDDDDDNDEENGDDHSISPANQHDNYQRFSPISKSKTLSDTTNISEINMLSKQHSPRQQQQQKRQLNYHQQQYLQPNQNQQQQPQQRFIKTTIANNTQQLQSQSSSNQDHHSEPKSMVLNSRDIGSFYKPHMNYSTNVLGNHRLSDDDEIIIIPTQSPSLVSNSPDPDHANADELTERFSISRTKSFWEKLSKGNHGKRASQVSSADNPSIKSHHIASYDNNTDNNNNNTINYNQQCQQQQQQQQSLQQPQHHQQQQLQQHQYNIGNNKQAIGVKLNGHSNTLDRMDSTGGSNSNYSCSSSGDENGVGSHSQQNPVISEQEMSRQNRLRQTR